MYIHDFEFTQEVKSCLVWKEAKTKDLASILILVKEVKISLWSKSEIIQQVQQFMDYITLERKEGQTLRGKEIIKIWIDNTR